MRFVNFQPIISAAITDDIQSGVIDINQIIRMSAQLVIGPGTATGALQFQVSNDICANGHMTPQVVPTHWSNLGSPINVVAAGTNLFAQTEMCYRWLRAIYTDNTVFSNTIVAVADVAGSLNNKYFLIQSGSVSYYAWFDNGTGVDPAIPGRTGVHITYTTADTASTIGGLIRTAFGSLPDFVVTGATTTAILTNTALGAVAPATDGAAPTGFAFSSNSPTANASVTIMCLSI